jgi:hypothetical protein
MVIYLDHDDVMTLPIGAKGSVGVVLVEAAESITARRLSLGPLCVELDFNQQARGVHKQEELLN